MRGLLILLLRLLSRVIQRLGTGGAGAMQAVPCSIFAAS